MSDKRLGPPEIPDALFLCDRLQCENCSWPTCKHTTDIKHAIHFEPLEDTGAYVETCRLSGTLVEPYGVLTLEPITRENIHMLKPGEWIWDNKLIERREHKLSLNPEMITEPIGFRQIHILDLKDFGTYTNKPFMLSDIDSDHHCYRWVDFEDGRFHMLERKD